MKIENCPIYNAVNLIDDPSLRSFAYHVIETNWDDFYNKKIVGLSTKTNNHKGYDIVYRTFEEVNFLCGELNMTTKDTDALRTLAIVVPGWIGDCLSKEKIQRWKYMSEAKMYRDRDWKELSKKIFYAGKLSEAVATFQVEHLWKHLTDIYYEEDDLITMIFNICYIYALRR